MKSLKLKITTFILIFAMAFSMLASNLVLAQSIPPAAPTPPPSPENNLQPPLPPPQPEAPQPLDYDSYINSTSQESQSQENDDTNQTQIYSGNSNNGSDSENNSDINSSSQTDASSQNSAIVANNLDLEAVTGENSSSRNTGSASIIDTGNAGIAAVIITGVNEVTVSGSGCGSCNGNGIVTTNSNNGSDSVNNATADVLSNTQIDIDNDALIDTEITALSLSGQNDASRNVGDSVILTGDANLTTTVITDANTTAFGVYNFDVSGNQTGDIILGENPTFCVNCGSSDIAAINTGNGSDSQNDAYVTNSNNLTEIIDNHGDVINNINLQAISGENDASRNTGGDSTIQTGNANVVANVINTLNTSVVGGLIYSVNIFGNLFGDIILPESSTAASSSCGCCSPNVVTANIGNGSDSENISQAKVDNETTITQTNNANIQNNLNLSGNTGNNETSKNTSGTSLVESGDVNISASTVNVANINVATSACSDPVYILVVNKIGDWFGKVLGLPQGSLIYAEDGTLYMVDSNGQLTAINSGNGSGSQNTSSINLANTTNINQENNANIVNNINIEANTGDNSASRNTGGNSTIKTGNANIALNIVNFINSNFSGRKVVMTFVNILGSFFGNIVGPNHQNTASNQDDEQDEEEFTQDDQDQDDNNEDEDLDQQEEDENGEEDILAETDTSGSEGVIDEAAAEEEQEGNDGEITDEIAQTAGFKWRLLLLAIPVVAILYLFRKRLLLFKLKK